MKEQRLDSLFKKAISESNEFYTNEADIAKEKIWNQVKTKKQVIPLFYRILAAASILLLIALLGLTYSNVQHRTIINELTETNSELKNNNQILNTTVKTRLTDSKPITDTIFVEKIISQLKPSVKTKYITDTIYLKEVVYIERNANKNAGNVSFNDKISNTNTELKLSNDESNLNMQNSIESSKDNSTKSIEQDTALASVVKNDTEVDKANIQTEIIIDNDNAAKPEKKRKFKIKFGRRHSKTEKKAMAISTTF